MSLFNFKFLRRFIRRHSKPIGEANAAKWKRILSVTYMLIAWNAFGIVTYQIVSGKSDWAKYHGLKTEEELALPPARQWAKTLGIKKAEVFKVSGFNVQHYTINDENVERNKE